MQQFLACVTSKPAAIHPPRCRRVSGLTLAARKALLVVSVSVPILAVAVVSQWQLYRAERAVAEGTLYHDAEAISQLVDQQFDRAIVVAETLAASSALRDGDMTVFGDEMSQAQREMDLVRPANAAPVVVTLFRADGTRVLSVGGSVTQLWKPAEADGVRLAVERRTAQISNLFLSPMSGQFRIAVAAPVFDRRHGADPAAAPVGVVAIALPPALFAAVAGSADLPRGSAVSIRDRSGVKVARTGADILSLGRDAIPPVMAALAGGDVGIIARNVARRDGVRATIALARSARSGYTVGLGIPEAVLAAPLNASLTRMAALGGGGLFLGIAFAVWLGRRTSRAVGGVAERARRAASRVELPKPTGVVEADALAATLAKSFADRNAAERMLRDRSDRTKALLDFSSSAFANTPEEHELAALVAAKVGSVLGAGVALHFVVSEATGRSSLVASAGGHGLAEELERPDLDNTACGAACLGCEQRPGCAADPESRSVAAILRDHGVQAFSCHPLKDDHGSTTGTLWFASRSRPAFDEEEIAFLKTASHIFGMIWQRTRSAQLLRDSEERYRALVDATGEGILIHQDGIIFDCNDVFCRMFDVAKSAVIGRSAFDFLDQASREIAIHETRFAQTAPYEVIAQRPDGSTFPIEMQERLFYFRGRRMRAARARDLTVQKQAEAALRDSEARFRGIAEATPQIVWSAEPNGYRDFYNRRTRELVGVEPERMMGDGWLDFVHPEDRERCRDHWRNAVLAEAEYEIQYRLRSTTGAHRWMLGRGLPVRDAEGRVSRWFGTSTDITHMVAARETLAASHEKLEQLVAERTRDLAASQSRLAHVARIEALGRLAGGIAHDFNNVLQAIEISGKLLESALGGAGRAERQLRTIARAVERGRAVTDRMLMFSRQGTLVTEPTPPAAFFESLGEMLRMTLGAAVDVRIETADGLPAMLVDRGQLETVVVNLATNARDAMPDGGTLMIRVDSERIAAAPPHAAHGLQPGDYVRISVRDDGTGMEPETLARVTEPFFTTKPVGRGTGLGLSMAHGFASQSRGALAIASEPGRGTEVTLWFPVAAAAEGADPPPVAVPALPRAARLLLVDDDELVRDALSDALQRRGFAVVAVASGADALAELERGDTIDALVSDYQMPGLSGTAVIAQARRLRPGLPAILLTGAADAEEDFHLDFPRERFVLLRKPISDQKLSARLTALLHPEEVAA